ncbi:hypothetical protein EFM27_14740, partial [Lactiplantibacillus plantarum]|nr:hypothetical protein [Lactiplantibacillus plantarum]
RNELACKNSFLLRDDLFIIRSLKSCLRNQLTSNKLFLIKALEKTLIIYKKRLLILLFVNNERLF